MKNLNCGCRSGAQFVAPDGIGPPRIIDRRIEDVLACGIQKRAARGARNLVSKVIGSAETNDGVGLACTSAGATGRGAADLTHTQRVSFVAFDVDAVKQQGAIVTEREGAKTEEVVTLGLDVVVEKNLFAGERCGRERSIRSRVTGSRLDDRRGSPIVGVGDRCPAVNGVLLTLFGATEIPPLAAANRHTQIGLLSARLDLFKDLLLQHTEVTGACRSEGILGVEVREGIGALLVAHPLVIVDVMVAMVNAFCGNFRGFRWGEHTFSVGRIAGERECGTLANSVTEKIDAPCRVRSLFNPTIGVSDVSPSRHRS